MKKTFENRLPSFRLSFSSLKVLTIVYLLLTHISMPAQYGNLQIKNRFDQVYTQLYGPIYNINTTANNINDQGQLTWNKAQLYTSIDSENALGSTRSGSLEGLLRMYETTCDMKYIWEFMEQATHIYNITANKVGQSSAPYWFINQVEWHGRILYPMAHFVHLVRSNPGLYNYTIPLLHRPNFANKTTIGAFADMQHINNVAVMDFLITTRGYWRGADECFCKVSTISDPCTNLAGNGLTKNIGELNFQAPFGMAFIYLYLSDPSRTDYGVHAVEMARAYLTTRGGILTYNAANAAYLWYHDGWQQRRDHTWTAWYNDHEFFEDIGHGSFDILFPVLYNKYYSSITGVITSGQYFENYQMVRFKNTFSRLIFNNSLTYPAGYSSGVAFKCNVWGGCIGMSGVSGPADIQMNAKCWIDLYKYDNTPGALGPKVYDILMGQYIHYESTLPINESNYGGVNMIGLAGLVEANWHNENILCPIARVNEGSSEADEGLNAANTENALQIFQSPSTGNLSLRPNTEIKQINVYDMSGKEILKRDQLNEIPFSEFQNGIYWMHILYKDETVARRKFSIQN